MNYLTKEVFISFESKTHHIKTHHVKTHYINHGGFHWHR